MVQSELLRNRTAEKLYGYSAAEALGSDLIEFLTDARDHDAANNIVHRVIRGKSWTVQFPVTNKQGDRFLVVAIDTPFYDDDGTLLGVICISSDKGKAIKRSTLSDLNTSFHSKGPVRNKNSQHARVTQQWKTTASKGFGTSDDALSQLEADDEADHINLPTTPCNTNSSHFCDSYHEGLDSDISSQSLNCFLPLPWHGGGEPLQPVDTPVVVETSKWSKLTMMKACKVLEVNESSFEHEILDIVLRMEEKRKNQIQEQKKVKDSRKGKNKADAELKKLAWGLQEGSGKKDRGRSHKGHSR
uniref:Map3k delta-1 protein kinase n=1 Tax=Solanum tuberosum TaxID=4113 RepID=M1CHH3_SOLTU